MFTARFFKPNFLLRKPLLLAVVFFSIGACGGEQKQPDAANNNTNDNAKEEIVKQTQTSTPNALKPKPSTAKPTLSKEKIYATSKSKMVYMGAGAVQCEFKGHSPEKTAEGLQKAGIEIIASHCGNKTGMMMAAVCGGGTTRINLYEIADEDIDAAVEAGYKPVDGLARGKEKGYAIGPCPESNDR